MVKRALRDTFDGSGVAWSPVPSHVVNLVPVITLSVVSCGVAICTAAAES